ncbi:methionine aminopeptidase [Synergistales bacterium]|nr:methionine aminopeptidase [Synergistales bacterium]GHV51430.1 methionine aminopeptidase [Synergistales bacterium]
MITFKKPNEIDKMRRAGKLVADAHHAMRDVIKPGVDTMTLDQVAERVLFAASAKASFKGYRVKHIPVPFPGTICVSINDEVVHGIPSSERFLEEGDIVSIDIGAYLDGYHGDAACTYAVGSISEKRKELLAVTQESLYMGIKQAVPGHTIGDVGHAVEEYVLSHACGLVRDYAGHGIGRKLHEAPQVPNYGKPGSGVTIKSSMTFCVEPMVMNGAEDVESTSNGWTVVTRDGSDAAHFEHTLLITEDGAEILTPWE